MVTATYRDYSFERYEQTVELDDEYVQELDAAYSEFGRGNFDIDELMRFISDNSPFNGMSTFFGSSSGIHVWDNALELSNATVAEEQFSYWGDYPEYMGCVYVSDYRLNVEMLTDDCVPTIASAYIMGVMQSFEDGDPYLNIDNYADTEEQWYSDAFENGVGGSLPDCIKDYVYQAWRGCTDYPADYLLSFDYDDLFDCLERAIELRDADMAERKAVAA